MINLDLIVLIFFLSYQELSVDFTVPLKDVTVPEGSTAHFECTLTIPVDKSKVKWFINNKEIEEDEKYEFIVDGTVQKLTIKDSTTVDAGVVTVRIDDKESSAKLTVEEISADFTIPLKDVTVKEGSTAVFECTLTIPVDKRKVQWFINDKQLDEDDKFEFIVDGAVLKLVIKDSTTVDAGIVTVRIGDKESAAKFTVEEVAVEFVVPLKDQTVFEKSSVEFTCQLNRDVDSVQWFLDAEELKPGDGIEIIKDGLTHKLTIHSVLVEDSGEITIKVPGVSSTADLTVQKLPVEFVMPLNDVSVMERQTAVFECELSRDVEKVYWFLDDLKLTESEHVKFVKDGCRHKLLIQDCSFDDEGLITIQAEDKKSTASLFIRGGLHRFTLLLFFFY